MDLLLPPNEGERLLAVQNLSGLRTERHAAFGHITRIAAEHFKVPIAYVSVVDRTEQWFAGSQGLDLVCTTRDQAFCSHTILSDDVLVVEDARLDPRFANHDLVTKPPFVRFYAGAPIIFDREIRVGSVCIADHEPRSLNLGQRIVLRNLAEIAMTEMRLLERRRDAA